MFAFKQMRDMGWSFLREAQHDEDNDLGEEAGEGRSHRDGCYTRAYGRHVCMR